jgi:hypothetical protein
MKGGFKMASNLPPGVSVSMLPGNRPEDIARETAEEKLLDALSVENLTPFEYEIVGEVGLGAVKVFRKCLAEEVRERCSECEMSVKMQAPFFKENEDKEGGLRNMPVDRVGNWKRFSEHMEQYIREQTIQKYGFGESGESGEPEKKTFDLMSITKPVVCVWNILRYSLRLWNGKGKEHDLEKIAHYAELAWTMEGEKSSYRD